MSVTSEKARLPNQSGATPDPSNQENVSDERSSVNQSSRSYDLSCVNRNQPQRQTLVGTESVPAAQALVTLQQPPPPVRTNSPLFTHHPPPYHPHPPTHHYVPPRHQPIMMPWRGPPPPQGPALYAPRGPPPFIDTQPYSNIMRMDRMDDDDTPTEPAKESVPAPPPPAAEERNPTNKSKPQQPVASWNDMLVELLKYRMKNGHCHVPTNVFPLGHWVERQRQFYGGRVGNTYNNRATIERIELLDSIGFVWDLKEHEWNMKLEELKKFHNEHGHCEVPKKDGNLRELGFWVDVQRCRYADKRFKENDALVQGRIDALDAIGFVWDIDGLDWFKSFAELQEYKKTNGHCNVSLHDGPLGLWVFEQRRLFHDGKLGNTVELAEKRANKLNSIGFEWSSNDFDWDMRFVELKAYQETHGNCNVHQDPLKAWVEKQRGFYKNRDSDVQKVLTEERIKALDELGFVWDEAETNKAWDDRFNDLVKFRRVHGHCNVPPRKSGIGNWVKTQRWKKKCANVISTGKPGPPSFSKLDPLTPEQIRRLEVIGFEWQIPRPTQGWEARFEQLREFKAEFGHCNVPHAYEANKELGKWVRKQRLEFTLRMNGKKSQLTDERMKRLDDEGFCWQAWSLPGKRQSLPMT